MRDFDKIIIIGKNKSGTTSLCEALRSFGLRGVHDSERYNTPEFWLKMGDNKPLRELDIPLDVDFYSDWPFLQVEVAEKFLEEYPESLIIHLLRNFEGWFDSAHKHVAKTRAPSTSKTPQWEGLWVNVTPESWIAKKEEKREAYKLEDRRIKRFLKKLPPDQYLITNICDDGEGWEKLCPFLEIEVPGRPFPHVNKTLT